MIIKRKKNNFYLIASIIVIFLIITFTFLSSNEKFLFKTMANLKQKIMTIDHGFSTWEHLKSTTISFQKDPIKKVGHLLNSIPLQLEGFPNRPTIETLEINIKFKNYKKILEDRKRFFTYGISSYKYGANGIAFNPREVKASIKYKGKIHKAKIRLKGLLIDHWDSIYRMSFRINLKDGTIFGFKNFSIHKPESRQYPYDQVYGKLQQTVGNLSTKQTFAHIIVNGQDWGIMNIEESISKELLEKQKHKESIIVKFGEKRTDYKIFAQNHKYKFYRLGNLKLITTVYQDKKYLKLPIYRRWLSYIANKRLQQNDLSIYNINKFTKTYLLTTLWGSFHSLLVTNSRYYFNPYLLQLEPIPTDAHPVQELSGFDHIPYAIPDPYNMIVGASLYKKELKNNLVLMKKTVDESQQYMDYYQRFFPADEAINITQQLNKNLETILNNPEEYLFPKINQKNHEMTVMPSKEQAKYFPEHIYAKHFTNGAIEIYNLLPDDVTVKGIKYKNEVLFDKNVRIPGFKNEQFIPVKLTTNVLGIADKQITIVTEYKGEIRNHVINVSYIEGPYFNPLIDIQPTKQEFLEKKTDKDWIIKKGIWKVKKPIVLTGKVTIEAGAHLTFSKDSYLIIKGQLIASGNNNAKIILDSADDYWKGLYIIGDGNNQSVLQHAVIKHTEALEDGLLQLTGGVTFYNSHVHISNTQITDTKAEDALNIVNSVFKIEKTKIGNTVSDAFDSDFSNGFVKNSLFFNVGGDAVDFSGSEIYIGHSSFEKVRDKAISVGESTNINLDDININDIGVGIASKDGSTVNAKNIFIQNYKLYAAMTYKKKDFYGQPKLMGQNIRLDSKNTDAFLAQKNTIMFVNDKKIDTKSIDIKALYQTETMKK